MNKKTSAVILAILGCGGVLLFFIFLPSIFLVLLVFVFNPLFFPFTLVFSLAIFSYFYRRNKKRKQVREEEYKESLSEGGIEDPKPFRDLLPHERVRLEEIIKNSNLLFKNIWLRLALMVGIGIVAFSLGNYVLNRSALLWLVYYPTVFVLEIILFFYVFKTIIQYFHKENIYHDLRVQVFKTQGKLIIESLSSKGERRYTMLVRGVEFPYDSLIDVRGVAEQLSDGEEVAVEYSPRTKHVWNIYKTEDI